MKMQMNPHQRNTRTLPLALALGAGLAVAALSGCSQQSSASTSGSDADSATPQTTSAAAPAAPAAPVAPSVEHGQQLFTVACTGCHGNQGQGIPHLGKDLQHSAFVAGLSDAQLVDFITQGRAVNDPANTTHVPMPAKGGNPALSAQDIADIAAYVRQLQMQSAPGK